MWRARVEIALSVHLLVGAAVVCAAGTVAVRSDDGVLWVDSRSAPAPEVFTAIARETGIRFVIGEELRPVPVNLKLEGVEIERAIRSLVGEIDAVGYAMSYQSLPGEGARLTEVAIYGARGRSANGTVFEERSPPLPSVLAPNYEEAAGALKASGVPAETIERVIALSRQLEAQRTRIAAGSYERSDLAPESAAALEPLLATGMSTEEAVRAVRIQEEAQRVLQEIAAVPGGSDVFQVLRRRSYIDYDE